MFFLVRDLELRPKQFDVDIAPGKIDFLDPQIRQVLPLKAKGKVELVSGALLEIRLTGHVTTRIEADCDRCLEKAEFPVDSEFDLLYRPAAEDGAPETPLNAEEAQMGFYEGDGLQLEDVFREFVLLTLPMQRVCKEGCKGLCPVCGQSRNLSDCHCESRKTDDRWAALKSLQ